MVHTDGNCQGCKDKLAMADDYLVAWFIAIKKQFPTIHVCWSFRDQEYQDKAFARGLSLNKWPTSKHNHMQDGKPSSLALDLFEVINGVASFNPDFYLSIYKWSLLNGFKIKWGGAFIHLRDYDHFYIEKSNV